MSNNASVAAAQRRRAGRNQNTRFVKPTNRTVNDNENYNNIDSLPTKPVLRLNDILHIQSKQINTLKNIIDKTNERWDDNDILLKEVCERIDNIEQLGEMYNSLLDRVIAIEKKLNITNSEDIEYDNNDETNNKDNDNKETINLVNNVDEKLSNDNLSDDKLTNNMLLSIQEKLNGSNNERLGIKKSKKK